MTPNQIRKIYEKELDIPVHKLQYLLGSGATEMLGGAFMKITYYKGGVMNKESFDIFFDVVHEKLADGSNIEYEFEDGEYETLMSVKQYIIK